MPVSISQVKKNLKDALCLELAYLKRHPKTLKLKGKPSAVLVLLGLNTQDELSLLFTKRHDSAPSHPGQISFPGGMKEDLDSDLVQTAVRETIEETDIQPSHYEIIGELPVLYTYSSDFLIHPVVALSKKPIDSLEINLNLSELEKYFWCTTSELERAYLKKEFNWMGKKIPNHTFNVNNFTIWGATGAMTRNLLDRMKQIV